MNDHAELCAQVAAQLGKRRKRSNLWVKVCCPVCSTGKSAALSVSMRTGFFVCFRCGLKGYLPEKDGKKEIVRPTGDLAERARVAFGRKPRPPIDTPLPEEFIPCWDGSKWRTPRYLTKVRHVSKPVIKDYGLGFCEHGRYAGRIVIPVITGQNRAFQARAIDPEVTRKYLNPPIPKSRFLFGVDHVRPAADTLLVCEGVFDVLRTVSETDYSCVALLGKAPSPAQLGMIVRIGARKTVFLLDSDAPDENRKLARALVPILDDDTAFIAKLEGKDPGESDADAIVAAVEGAVHFEDDGSPLRERLGKLTSRS